MRFAEVFARVLGDALDVPVEVAAEIVADLRMMDDDLDGAFDDEREDPEGDALKLYEGLTRNPALVGWFEKRARIARGTLDAPAS